LETCAILDQEQSAKYAVVEEGHCKKPTKILKSNLIFGLGEKVVRMLAVYFSKSNSWLTLK